MTLAHRKQSPVVTYVNGNRWIWRFLARIGLQFDAITLPPFGIYMKDEYVADKILLYHELVHWRQYQDYGSWAIVFYARYLYYWVTAPFSYYKNKLEVEARNKSLQSSPLTWDQVYGLWGTLQ